MRLTRRVTRDQLTNPNGEHLPDGIGGTITGGPMEPIGLPEILERGARGASHGGAVSGAAQVVTGGPRRTLLTEPGFALSDGSRICFASLADAGLFPDDDAPMPGNRRTQVPKDSEPPMSRDGSLRAKAVGKARSKHTHRARVLASV